MIDPDIFKGKADYAKTSQIISEYSDYVSLSALVEDQVMNNKAGKRIVYKLATRGSTAQSAESFKCTAATASLGEGHFLVSGIGFFSLKIKRENYLGEPAIALYVRNVSKKIENHLSRMVNEEERV